MHISIIGLDNFITNGVRDSVVRRVKRALSRFSGRIAQVDVSITDENSSRGGVDKHCRIRVRMPGIKPFVATAKDESPWAAVTHAVNRARRMIMTKLKRPRSQRARSRRNRWYNSDSPDL